MPLSKEHAEVVASVEADIGHLYRITGRISAGAFGVVYSCQDVQFHEELAMKLEPLDADHPQLWREVEAYNALEGGEGIPSIKWSGVAGKYNVLVMERLGPSLDELQKKVCRGILSLETVCLLAEQMIARIRFLHSRGYIHRDLKPANFVMGLGSQQDVVHLIDFGMVQKYRKQGQSGKEEHIPYREGVTRMGSPRYASINALVGVEQSRRDDVEALGYVFLYLLRGTLPWQKKNPSGINPRDQTPLQRFQVAAKAKSDTTLEELCEGFPPQFETYVSYSRGLAFEEDPDYEYLSDVFRDMVDWNTMGRRHLWNNRQRSFVPVQMGVSSGDRRLDWFLDRNVARLAQLCHPDGSPLYPVLKESTRRTRTSTNNSATGSLIGSGRAAASARASTRASGVARDGAATHRLPTKDVAPILEEEADDAAGTSAAKEKKAADKKDKPDAERKRVLKSGHHAPKLPKAADLQEEQMRALAALEARTTTRPESAGTQRPPSATSVERPPSRPPQQPPTAQATAQATATVRSAVKSTAQSPPPPAVAPPVVQPVTTAEQAAAAEGVAADNKTAKPVNVHATARHAASPPVPAPPRGESPNRMISKLSSRQHGLNNDHVTKLERSRQELAERMRHDDDPKIAMQAVRAALERTNTLSRVFQAYRDGDKKTARMLLPVELTGILPLDKMVYDKGARNETKDATSRTAAESTEDSQTEALLVRKGADFRVHVVHSELSGRPVVRRHTPRGNGSTADASTGRGALTPRRPLQVAQEALGLQPTPPRSPRCLRQSPYFGKGRACAGVQDLLSPRGRTGGAGGGQYGTPPSSARGRTSPRAPPAAAVHPFQPAMSPRDTPPPAALHAPANGHYIGVDLRPPLLPTVASTPRRGAK